MPYIPGNPLVQYEGTKVRIDSVVASGFPGRTTGRHLARPARWGYCGNLAEAHVNISISIIEQLTAVTIFFVFFMGVTCGVVGGAAWGSLLEDGERSLLSAAPDALSTGARFIFGVFRLDDGYLERMLHRDSQPPAARNERRGDDPGAQRKDLPR